MACSRITKPETRLAYATGGPEAHSRSVAKAVSWRLTGTLDTFIVSLFITGRFTLAGSIAATEFLTKIALYYGHERTWSLVRWGRG